MPLTDTKTVLALGTALELVLDPEFDEFDFDPLPQFLADVTGAPAFLFDETGKPAGYTDRETVIHLLRTGLAAARWGALTLDSAFDDQLTEIANNLLECQELGAFDMTDGWAHMLCLVEVMKPGLMTTRMAFGDHASQACDMIETRTDWLIKMTWQIACHEAPHKGDQDVRFMTLDAVQEVLGVDLPY